MDLAVEILSKARDRTLAASREKFNANQTGLNFEPGERVRLWKRVVVRRHANASDLESSKLKLFNSEFEVVKRVGNNYEIKDVITGKITTANVTQIARIRSVAPPAPEPPVVDASEKTWDRMEEGTFCVIWVKDEEKSVLRVLEVLEVEVQSEYLLGWHFIHKGFSSVYNPELPLVQRRLVPEWAHRRTQQRSPTKPPANQVHNYEKFTVNIMPEISKLFVPDSIFSLMENFQNRCVSRPTRGSERRLARRQGPCSRFLIPILMKCQNSLGSVKGDEKGGMRDDSVVQHYPHTNPRRNLCSGGGCVIEVLLAHARVAP